MPLVGTKVTVSVVSESDLSWMVSGAERLEKNVKLGYEYITNALNINVRPGGLIACCSTSLLQPLSPARHACPINVMVVEPVSPLISHSRGLTAAPTEQVKLDDVLPTKATYRSIGSSDATADGVNVTSATFDGVIVTLIAIGATGKSKVFQTILKWDEK